jgi:hypothetical protein
MLIGLSLLMRYTKGAQLRNSTIAIASNIEISTVQSALVSPTVGVGIALLLTPSLRTQTLTFAESVMHELRCTNLQHL